MPLSHSCIPWDRIDVFSPSRLIVVTPQKRETVHESFGTLWFPPDRPYPSSNASDLSVN